MRRGTAAIPFGAALVAVAAAFAVAVGARLGEVRPAELQPPVRSTAGVPMAIAIDPSVAVERVDESRSDVDRGKKQPHDRVARSFVRTLHVVRGDDRSPLVGAEVAIDDGSREDGCDDLRCTDERGELDLVVAACVHVDVRAPGFAEERLRLDPDSSEGGVTVELHRTCVVTGRVVAADGRPLEGAEVFALGRFRRIVGNERVEGGMRRTNDRTHLGASDSEGRFGPVECCAFVVTAFEVKAGDRAVVVPRVARDSRCGARVDVELRLPSPVELVVRIVDAAGRRANEASFDLWWTRQFDLFSELHGHGSFDEQGSAAIALVATGRYRVEVFDHSSVDENGELRSVAVEVQVGRGTHEVTVVVPWAEAAAEGPEPEDGVIRGTVACDCFEEEQCNSLRVTLWRGGEEVAGVDRSESGAYEFEGLSPGEYRVVAEGKRHLRVESAACFVEAGEELAVPWLHASTLAHRDPDGSEVEEAPEPSEPPTGSIHGAITGNHGVTGCAALRVTLLREGSDVALVAQQDARSYALAEVEAGRWSVVASGAGIRRAATAWFAVAEGEEVEAPPLEVEVLEPFCGWIRDEEGRPLASIELEMVGALDPDHEQVRGRSDPSGFFRMARFEGGSFLEVVDAAVGCFRFAVPSEPCGDWIVTLPRPRRIVGRVVMPTGVAPELLLVSFSGESDAFGQVRVAPDGSFEFARAPSRDCVLRLRFDRWLEGNYLIAQRDVPAIGDVDLGAWELSAPR